MTLSLQSFLSMLPMRMWTLLITSVRIPAATSLSCWELLISIGKTKKNKEDIPREGLDVEIEVEVESDIDTEILSTLVKGANDGVEASLDLDLGRGGRDGLDSVLDVSRNLLQNGEVASKRWG